VAQASLEWGLAEQLTRHVLEQIDENTNTSNFDRILNESLESEVLFLLKQNEADQLANEFLAKFPDARESRSIWKQRREISRLLEADKTIEARELLDTNQIGSLFPDFELRIACRLGSNASSKATFEWIGEMSSLYEKELAYRLASVLITRRGEVEQLWVTSQKQDLSATDQCMRNLGLINGLQSTNAYQSPRPEDPAEAT